MKSLFVFGAASVLLTACGGGESVAAPQTVPRTGAADGRVRALAAVARPPVAPPASRCQMQAGAPYGQTVAIVGTKIMVTSADIQASTAGCKVLAAGGTAIDATIAVQAVLGVAEPFASGLGGGSVITYFDAAARQDHTYDGLSAAPATTGGVPDIYRAVAQDVSGSAPFNTERQYSTRHRIVPGIEHKSPYAICSALPFTSVTT